MARNRRRQQGGVQWRRNLRNLPVRQAAAAQAAAQKQPRNAIAAAPPRAAAAAPRPRPRRQRGRQRARQRANNAPNRPWFRPAGRGEKNIDNAFIRNRGKYKIKRFLPQTQNINVKKNGNIIRRMHVRRQAVYIQENQNGRF